MSVFQFYSCTKCDGHLHLFATPRQSPKLRPWGPILRETRQGLPVSQVVYQKHNSEWKRVKNSITEWKYVDIVLMFVIQVWWNWQPVREGGPHTKENFFHERVGHSTSLCSSQRRFVGHKEVMITDKKWMTWQFHSSISTLARKEMNSYISLFFGHIPDSEIFWKCRKLSFLAWVFAKSLSFWKISLSF